MFGNTFAFITDAEPVFFSVAASQEEPYEQGDIIKFHHVISNVNPGFPGWNPATNQFTCPYDGHYFFMANIYKFDGANPYNTNNYTRLRMSGVEDIVELRNERLEERGGDMVIFSSSMSAIVPCESGQQVWVAMTADTSEGEREIHDSFVHRNHFLGMLIREGLDEQTIN